LTVSDRFGRKIEACHRKSDTGDHICIIEDIDAAGKLSGTCELRANWPALVLVVGLLGSLAFAGIRLGYESLE
jgi:hypothetical protein